MDKRHLAIAEKYIDRLVTDGVMYREWVLMQLTAVAAEGEALASPNTPPPRHRLSSTRGRRWRSGARFIRKSAASGAIAIRPGSGKSGLNGTMTRWTSERT